jgi:serine protease Do
VDPSGPAAELGLKAGDVILDVGGKAVKNAADVRKAIDDAQAAGKNAILMRVKTADATRFIAIQFGKA